MRRLTYLAIVLAAATIVIQAQARYLPHGPLVGSLTVQMIYQGNHANVTQRTSGTIRNPSAYRHLLHRIFRHRVQMDSQPVNFDHYTVVYAILPEKIRGATRLKFEHAELMKGVLRVTLKISTPGRSCLRSQNLLSPYAVARIRISPERVRHLHLIRHHATYRCRRLEE